MANLTASVVLVLLAAISGIAASATLYFLVVGLFAWMGTGPASLEASGIWRLSWQFGMTFGLLPGAHWALAAARAYAFERHAMLLVKGMAIAMVALTLALLLTGGRWDAMFGGLGGPIAILVLLWMAMTHYGSKALDKRTPAKSPAGA